MSENQKIVYHYCSIDTFKNIIKSKVLWLCNLRDSNDEEEIIRIYSVIWENVKNKLKKSRILNYMYEISDEFEAFNLVIV